MEVFMTNIGQTTNQIQIITEIAKVVHGPSYADLNVGSLLNFDVHLNRPKKQRGIAASYRTGTVTFPTQEVGVRFLRKCGGPNPLVTITAGHTYIRFKESNKPARNDVLENIQRLPFIDPRVQQENNNIQKLVEQSNVSISAIQFGWDCRDEVFSIEYERSNLSSCQLQFDSDSREFRITLAGSSGGVDGSSENEIIAIGSSQIRHAYANNDSASGQASIYFNLWYAPTFQRLRAVSVDPLFDFMDILTEPLPDPKPLRSRACSLKDENHGRVSPYLSTAMRFICTSQIDYQTFKKLWETTQKHFPIIVQKYRVERRGLFSLYILDQLHGWLEQLEWPVAFHVDALVRNGTTDPKELLSIRTEIDNLVLKEGKNYSAGFLRFFGVEMRANWFSESSQSRESIKECLQRCLRERGYKHSATAVAEDLFHCLHVDVTPTTILLDGPYPERTNRVTRAYPDNSDYFLRVSFVDENRLQFRFDREVDGRAFIDGHVGKILREGLIVGGRRFEFLAYSQSALKDHAVWFLCPFYDEGTQLWVNTRTIINNIGTFENLNFDQRLLYCPARYAARISQAFTATDASVTIEAEEIIIVRDIERNGSCFTDGVGTVSPTLANEMWGALCSKNRRRMNPFYPRPRAFQIRFQGSKGMISVDHKNEGRILVLRPSMIKFENPVSNSIEIAGVFNRPGKMFLNRPLIMLLEGLGVPAQVFLNLQESAVKKVMEASKSVEATAFMLDHYGLGISFRMPSVLRSLAKLGCVPIDLFYTRSLESAIFHILRDLKHRARIPVPGWTLVGVADIHSYLEENQVFVCLEEKKGQRKYLKGPVCISRSPTIHPGDVQIAHAIGPPPVDSPFATERLQNTLVFSTKGHRSLPSCLGGGDLDGDMYNITNYEELLPKKRHEPASYEAVKRKELDRPSTMTDVIDFIVDYINADNVGIIATSWLIIADQSTAGIFDPDCIKLAKLHSDAVDYPKSGNSVPMTEIPRLKFSAKPDWNEPEMKRMQNKDKYYRSERAIGKLYRAIELSDISLSSLEKDRLDTVVQSAPEFPTIGDTLCRAIQLRVSQFVYSFSISPDQTSHIDDIFWQYSEQLRYICSSHTMNQSQNSRLSEAEVFVGTIKAKTSQPKKRKDLISRMREQSNQLVADIRFELAGQDEVPDRERLLLAYGAWQLSLKKMGKTVFGARSFFWIALGVIFDTIKAIEEDDEHGN